MRTDEGTTRRTLLKGAAWSVPAVAAAAAVPARAASCLPCEGYEVVQTFEKQTGAWQYRDTITVTHCGEAISLQGVVVTVKFSNPADFDHATNADGMTTSYDPATGVLTATSTTSDTSMYFSGAIGHGNDDTHLVTGTVSLQVPGCDGFVIENRPFAVQVVKN
ncbi:hypothetical protein [Microbacterium bovistercoris]|uniref:hypothetical protein n=1 Tax=Microbacterium bovistercoris TaxID=2293570 RepID=UPI001FE4D395|nr:hypothetical protein [Microbacterium bovistercoris]